MEAQRTLGPVPLRPTLVYPCAAVTSHLVHDPVPGPAPRVPHVLRLQARQLRAAAAEPRQLKQQIPGGPQGTDRQLLQRQQPRQSV